MDIPILGTIDFTPSGIFLFSAAVLAIGYFGYQLFGTGRAGRNNKETDQAAQVEAEDADGGESVVDSADDAAYEAEPTAKIAKVKRPKADRPKADRPEVDEPETDRPKN
jgi:hypothetical protein